MNRLYVDVSKESIAELFTDGEKHFTILHGLPEGCVLDEVQHIPAWGDNKTLRLLFKPTPSLHFADDVEVRPVVASLDKTLEPIRKANALAVDYLSHDFPISPEEMCVEFTDVIEEIYALLNPIVEAADE